MPVRYDFEWKGQAHRLCSHDYADFEDIRAGDTMVLFCDGVTCRGVVVTVPNDCELTFEPFKCSELTALLLENPKGTGISFMIYGSSFRKDGHTFFKTDWKALEDEDLLMEEIEI